jgi:F-box/leucine-rich repeat protein 14
LARCHYITENGLQQLVKLTSLQELDLTYCEITDNGLQYLAQLTSLRVLDLSRENTILKVKITDKGLQHLTTLTKLQQLSMEYCDNITNYGLQHLTKLICEAVKVLMNVNCIIQI